MAGSGASEYPAGFPATAYQTTAEPRALLRNAQGQYEVQDRRQDAVIADSHFANPTGLQAQEAPSCRSQLMR